MKQFYRLVSVLLCLILVLSAFTGCKKKNTVTKEYLYDSTDENGSTEFPETIEIDGQTYRITGATDIDYETVSTTEVVQRVVDVTVADETDIPKKQDFDVNGKHYTFDLAETDLQSGQVEMTATAAADYPACVGKPHNVSETMPITVMIDGKATEIEGALQGIEQTSEYDWRDDLYVTGMYVGDPATALYNLQGTSITVPYDANSPTWGGYRDDVRDALGLSSYNYEILNGTWTSRGTVNSNGQFARYAGYTGNRYVADFTATYTVTYMTGGFSGTATYRVNADKVNAPQSDRTTVYTIKAIVTYQLVESSNN